MDTQMLFAAKLGLDLMARQFDTPEWRHRAEVLAAREPWSERFARQVRRLKLLASQPWPAWERLEESR
jgi:hypothetical protein